MRSMLNDNITQDGVDPTIHADKEETDKNDTASLAHLANTCAKQLRTLTKGEQSNDVEQHKYWASRQVAEYNIWCSNIGMHSEGSRSIDVRLKDVPEICKLLKDLLQSLRDDLNELQSPPSNIAPTSEIGDFSDDTDSEISFRSLSSSNDSKDKDFDDDNGATKERDISLQIHISDTIDRLQELARQIQRAGAQHRRQRVDLYREKERPKQVYEGFKKLGLWKANDTFKSATDMMKTRIAESFARRRIRFEYLEAHQKKQALQKPVPQLRPMGVLQTVPEYADVQATPAQPRLTPRVHHGSFAPYPEDQKTIFSATVDTVFNFRPEHKMKQRAESVRSVAIRNTGFPPPPQTQGDFFQCPYCGLTLGAREAETGRWSQHVIQDFEPYFCTVEDCKAPFDVPNSFEGLLDHMQTHVPVLLHVEESDGHHKEYREEEFEKHMSLQMEERGESSVDLMTALKEYSRRRGAFLFEDCPFCGGYPDVVEKRFPDSSTIEAQSELRRHIKQHMQEITLFLPPYRSDIVDNDDDTKGSDFAERQSVQEHIPENLDDVVAICDQLDCACRDAGTTSPLDVYDGTELPQGFWSDLFDDAAFYNRSPVSIQEMWTDLRLRTFMARAVVQALNTDYDNYDWFESYVSELGASELPLLFMAHNTFTDSQQSMDIVQALITMGADLEVKDRQGHTLLSQSLGEHDFDLAKSLIDSGANIDSKDNWGRSPLTLAAQLDQPDILRELLSAGANFESPNDEGRTPLAEAAVRGHCDVMKILLDFGADIETKDLWGQTPLASASDNNNLEAVELLLDNGACINATDNRRFRPIDKASILGFSNLYDLLMRRGAAPINNVGQYFLTNDRNSNILSSAAVPPTEAGKDAEWAANLNAPVEREITETQSLDREKIHESAAIPLNIDDNADSEDEDRKLCTHTSEHDGMDGNDASSAGSLSSPPHSPEQGTPNSTMWLPAAGSGHSVTAGASTLNPANATSPAPRGLTASGQPRKKPGPKPKPVVEENSLPTRAGPSQSATTGLEIGPTTGKLPGTSSNDTSLKDSQADFGTTDPEKGGHLVLKLNDELPFDFISDLGMGGLAKVSHVRSKATLQAYALKQLGLPKSGPRREQVREAFRYEAQIMRRISHRHIIRVMGSFESDWSAGILIVPIAECDLAQYLCTNPAKHGFTDTLKTFFGCLATGLEYLHSLSIRHNDITPPNILVRNGTVLLSGFGTAVDCKSTREYTKSPRDSMYTPQYCSPEKFEGGILGYATDIWSLGCVFIEMMAAIKGIGADELRSRYPETGGFSSAYHRNSEATSQLTDMWMEDIGTSQWLVEVIDNMLMSRPGERPLATTIKQILCNNSQDSNEWCGSCCASRMPTPQARTMVMPDRMRWMYRDHQGAAQGPFSGLEMHDWYKAGFFSPELLVKKLEDSLYEPLVQVIRKTGNTEEPFLVPQIGIPHGPPSQATESQLPPIIPRPPAPRTSRVIEEAAKRPTAPPPPFSHVHQPSWTEQEHQNPGNDIIPQPQQSPPDAEQELGIRHNVNQVHQILVENFKAGMDRTTAAMCMKMFDNGKKEYLLTDEVRAVLKFLTAWRLLFDRFAKNPGADNISYDQFSEALHAFGYRVSQSFTRLLFNTSLDHDREQELFNRSLKARETLRPGKMTFDRFVQACITLKRGTDAFKKFDDDRDGYITLDFDDFMDSMVEALPDSREFRTPEDEPEMPYGAITTPPDSSDEDEDQRNFGREVLREFQALQHSSDQGGAAKSMAATPTQSQSFVARGRSDPDLNPWVGGFRRTAPIKHHTSAELKGESVNKKPMKYLGSKSLIDNVEDLPNQSQSSLAERSSGSDSNTRLGGFPRAGPIRHPTGANSREKSVNEEPIEYLGSKALMDDPEDI